MAVMQNESNKLECPDEQVLGDYVSGRLEEPQLGQCEAHLAKCDQCEETIRGMFREDTANDSFDQLAVEALAGDESFSVEDAPLVDQLIRGLARRVPGEEVALHALESRAAEVNCLLPPSNNDESIGRVASYEITRLLGAGSTGIVYEAYDPSLNRKVALKILRPSLGDAARERFMNEARAAAAISHPNVITIYQVGEEEQLAFIAMELTDGQTLEARLNDVAFIPEDEVRNTATQVAQGLAAAHRSGLIHRDIKPANIWLKAEDGQAVILDFGLARIADDDPQMTATGMLAGTPNFMSPEQTRGLELDGRSDLFSLGCLMYRASTGKLPFGSTGILATLQSIQHDQPRAPKLLNPHLSDDFSDLMMGLLEKQPPNRPANADQLVRALQSDRKQWPFVVANYGEPSKAASSATVSANSSTKSSGFKHWVTAALLVIGLGGVSWMFAPQIFRIATDQGELVIDAKDEAVEVGVLQGGKLVRVIDTKTDQSIDIKSGEYELIIKETKNGLRLSSDRVVLTRGGRIVVSVGRSDSALKAEVADASPVGKFTENEVAVMNNLRLVALSLLNYETTKQRLPAIGNRNGPGNLLLSWRVHLLPYLGHQELYDEFRRDEPWDSPHNVDLLARMPDVYSDPTNPRLNWSGKTRILAPCSHGMLMDFSRKISDEESKMSHMIDGPNQTMALLQVSEERALEWTKPDDWHFNAVSVNEDLANGNARLIFALLDGSIHTAKAPLSAEFIKALATVSGRETVDLVNQSVTGVPEIPARPSMNVLSRVESQNIPAQFGNPGSMGGAYVPPQIKFSPAAHANTRVKPVAAGPTYAGRTFDQWMHVVKNDRQLKTKFDALAAVAELAQGDEELKKQVLSEIKPLLRKHGSRTMEGGDPFRKELTGGTVKNNFRDGELTHLFIEILRRFSADDLMKFAIDEIRNGTANSCEFLTWLWMPSSMRENDPDRQFEYFQAIQNHAVDIASAVLETVEGCDKNSRVALFGTIENVGSKVGLNLDPEKDPFVQFYTQSNQGSKLELPIEWERVIANAFDSDQPMKRGFVAVSMARGFPEHPNLTEDLANLLADKNALPELRAAALYALEELPFEKIEPVANRLFEVGKQSGSEKDRLVAWTKKHIHWPSNQLLGNGVNGSYPVDADARIGFLLSQLDEPPAELLPWLKQLLAKAKADPGRPRYGGPDQAVENTKIVITRAIEAVENKLADEEISSQSDNLPSDFTKDVDPK